MTDSTFLNPERFSVGAVGEVGSRVFLLQAIEGARVLTVKVEKQQIAVLATYLTRAIEGMGRPGHLPEEMELVLDPDQGIDFIAGNISVAIDDASGNVEVQIESIEDDDLGMDTATILVTKEQAAAFAIHATQLVEAGRPPCPLCGLPLDPRGHDCPRTNGHRAPIT
jgi:uncharacterized repeat protein (TIGR03847 family)